MHNLVALVCKCSQAQSVFYGYTVKSHSDCWQAEVWLMKAHRGHRELCASQLVDFKIGRGSNGNKYHILHSYFCDALKPRVGSSDLCCDTGCVSLRDIRVVDRILSVSFALGEDWVELSMNTRALILEIGNIRDHERRPVAV